MIKVIENESELIVQNRTYVGALIFLCMIPFLLMEHGKNLVSGDLDPLAMVGLLFGILLPLFGAYYFIEFGMYKFSKKDQSFAWQWTNLFRKEAGVMPLAEIAKVRRDAHESKDLLGWQNTYRLIVITVNSKSIPLSRSFSGIQNREMDTIVNQIREFIG